jgi:hypothetical protein
MTLEDSLSMDFFCCTNRLECKAYGSTSLLHPVRIKSHLERGTVHYENANTKQEQGQPLSSFQNTMTKFMNKAYAFVDGEARCLTDIRRDLEIRAGRTITTALGQIEGVLSAGMRGGYFVARRDPKILVPSLSALQRVLFRDGLVTFEDVGIYKDDRFKSGDKIIPQNTNPLQQGNFDPVTAPFGTLGHFVSTLQEPEMSDEWKREMWMLEDIPFLVDPQGVDFMYPA